MITEDDAWVTEIAAHTGEPDLDAVWRATETMIGALGALVPPADHARVAAELPPRLAAAFRAARVRTTPLAALALPPETASARAHELIAAACGVLAGRLAPSTLAGLRAELPAAVARLLVAPSHAIAHQPRRVERRTLADGRPGSQHPVSEAGRRDAQSDSIRTVNPHGDVKLSSSAGATQERDHDTLAEAGSHRTLARRHE